MVRVLIAEDELISRRLLEATLSRQGYEVLSVDNGDAAWEELEKEDAPRLAVLDWMMPGMDGTDVCRKVREKVDADYCYMILLSARAQKEDIVEGLESGADDYLTKPFHPQELTSRIKAGERIIALETALSGKVDELQEAMAHVKTLQGLLPICMHCKKIRDNGDTWHKMENYISDHSGAMFTHSLCEDCLATHYPSRN